MKKRIIVALTALSVLAFPMSAFAAGSNPQTYVCPVAGCQIVGQHTHNGNQAYCSVSGCTINGQHNHANGLHNEQHNGHRSGEYSYGTGGHH